MRPPSGRVARQRVKALAASASSGSRAAAGGDCAIVGPPGNQERGSHGSGAGARFHAALPEGHGLFRMGARDARRVVRMNGLGAVSARQAVCRRTEESSIRRPWLLWQSRSNKGDGIGTTPVYTPPDARAVHTPARKRSKPAPCTKLHAIGKPSKPERIGSAGARYNNTNPRGEQDG